MATIGHLVRPVRLVWVSRGRSRQQIGIGRTARAGPGRPFWPDHSCWPGPTDRFGPTARAGPGPCGRRQFCFHTAIFFAVYDRVLFKTGSRPDYRTRTYATVLPALLRRSTDVTTCCILSCRSVGSAYELVLAPILLGIDTFDVKSSDCVV